MKVQFQEKERNIIVLISIVVAILSLLITVGVCCYFIGYNANNSTEEASTPQTTTTKIASVSFEIPNTWENITVDKTDYACFLISDKASAMISTMKDKTIPDDFFDSELKDYAEETHPKILKKSTKRINGLKFHYALIESKDLLEDKFRHNEYYVGVIDDALYKITMHYPKNEKKYAKEMKQVLSTIKVDS